MNATTMNTGDQTLFADQKGPWWMKIVTYWGLPGAIIIFLFWKDLKENQEQRDDDKAVVEVLKQTTGVMTEFKGSVDKMNYALDKNTDAINRLREERRRDR